MKSVIWILVSLLFSGHTIEGFGVQYDGGHESGRHVSQTRTTRYVDGASGSWNTNIGYTNTKETEGGALEGLLETVSSISSGKGQGSDQVNAKGSFQIKVDANAAAARPTAILGSVLGNAASAIGSLSDLAKKNIESRRNFQGSFALESNSYLGANGHNFADQDQIIGTNRHDATGSTKVVTVASQSQITSNSEAVNGFKSEGRRKDSRFTEHFSENLGINGGIRNGQNEDAISEQNSSLQKEVIISSLPSTVSTGTTSTFEGSRIASSNFGSQFSTRKDESYSVHPDDQVKTRQNYFSKSEESQSHILNAAPATQFSSNFEYENESGSGHGHRTLSANVGSGRFPSSIEEDGGVTTHAQEGATNIQNLKTLSQTSSLKTYTSSNGNSHYNSHADDYKDSDESIEIEDYSTISQKEVAGKSGQHVLANGQFDIKTAEENSGLRSQYSGIGHTIEYDSSNESEEEDSTYLHESAHLTGNTGQGRSAQNIPHPTLLNFRPDSDYIDSDESDESEEIEDNGPEVLKTLSVSSQVNQARPTIEFQKGITGDYLLNLQEQGSSGYEKSHTESSASNSGRDLYSASSDLQNKEKFSGTKLVQTEVSTTTHFNGNAEDAEDFSEYRTGYPSYLLQESSSKKIASNVRNNNKNRNDDSSELDRHGLAGVETGASSTSIGKLSDNSALDEKDEYEYTSGFASSEEAVRQEKVRGSFTSNTRGLSKSEDKEENNHETSVTITSSNHQNLGRASDFAVTDGRSEKSQFRAGQVARRGYNQNYGENEESTNRRLFEEGRQVITNSEGLHRSSFTLEPEERRRLIASSGGQHFESRGEVADTVLDISGHESPRKVHQFRSEAYPIVDDRDQNSRAFSQGFDYFHEHPGTKIVRKEITETVHTAGGPPHEFEHRQIHRRPLRRNFNEGGFGSISQHDFLNTDRQLHELHHGHDHDRFEGRLLSRRSKKGYLDHFDSPHNIEGDVGFGTQGHILSEIHGHGGGREFEQFHSAPISYPGEGHEGGRVGFRKIVKVTHEIEDVPRHGREVEFGHRHYYH